MKHYSECHKWYCGINVYMKSGASELEFQRTCKTKKDAMELAEWIHRQYAESASSEVLTLEMPCKSKRQAPRTLSFRTRDVCAITTVIGIYDEDGDEHAFKIEPGFRITEGFEYDPADNTPANGKELVAMR